MGEVHGANKPLDPNYKPEHQLKSKLPSVTGKSSPTKTPRKPILRTPARPTPKALTTPKSVKIQSESMDDMPAPIPKLTLMGTPVSMQGGAQPKSHQVDGTPLLPPTALPSPSQLQPLVPRRILSSTLSGEDGEDMDRGGTLIRDHEEKKHILKDQNSVVLLQYGLSPFTLNPFFLIQFRIWNNSSSWFMCSTS